MKNRGLQQAFANGGVAGEFYPTQETEELMRRERMAMDDVMGRMKYARRSERQALGAELGNMIKGFGDRYMPAGQGQPSENNFVMQNTMQNLDGLKSSLFDMAKYRPRSGAMAGQGVSAIGQVMNNYLTEKEPVVGFRQGGTVGVDQRGFIKGPSGVDNVPARVDETGEEIRVGAGERIVNKDQNAALEALAAEAGMSLDEYLAASTGKPVGPTMKKGLRGLNRGGFVDDYGTLREPNRFQKAPERVILSSQLANANTAPQPAPTGQVVRSGFQQLPADTTAFDNEVRARAEANRLKAASKGVVVEPSVTAPAPAAQPAAAAQPATQGRLARAGNAAKSALGTVGKVAGAAAGLSGAYEMATGETPADQVAGGLKALAAVPSGPAQIVGGAALIGDQLLQSKTGKGLGHYLDKLAQMHPDYMANNPAAQAPATQAPAQAPVITKDPSYSNKEAASATGNMAARQEVDNPNIRGLRQAGVRSINTIDTPNGKVYTGRDAKGQLVVNSNVTDGGQAAADAAREKQFAAADYGKDAYGNWMTPQRLADKQALERIQSERAQFAAFNDQITDPAARAAGLRKVAFDMANEDRAGKRAVEQAKLNMEQAKFDQEERKMTNLQGNSDREFEQRVASENAKRFDEILKSKATVDGKLNGELYARMQEYAGNFKSKFKEGTQAYYKDLMDNLGVDSAFAADEGNLFRRVRSQGSDVAQGLRQQDGLLWGKYLQDPVTGRQLSFYEISKMAPSQQRVVISRVGDPNLKAELMKQFGIAQQ